ncbi:MAG: hypothetical protein ABIG20_04735 [archaeon]
MNFSKEQLAEHEKNSAITKRELKEALSSSDQRISQIVTSISELDESINVNVERLREWYMLYYPEVVAKIKNNEAFVKATAKAKSRDDFHDVPKDSIGADFAQTDVDTMRILARSIQETYELQEKFRNVLKTLMKANYPNLQTVAGDIVGAKLIAHAGDAERLARMASSTIQILGAEKALFRHMTTGAKSPKYGILLQHQLLQSARRGEKGKVARAVAGKISIAVKVDVYGGEYCGDKLRKDMERAVERIKEKAKRKGLKG